MLRKTVVNLSLLALGLGSLGLVYWTRDAPTTGELEARKSKLLQRFSTELVTRIRLRKGNDELVLTRGAQKVAAKPGEGDEADDEHAAQAAADFEFAIEQPFHERADAGTTRALLSSLDLATPLREASDVSEANAGLVAPRLVIDIELGAHRERLRIGGPAPAPLAARYAAISEAGGSERLVTVSDGLVAELDLPFDKFRETRLSQLGRSEVNAIEISRGGLSLKLTVATEPARFSVGGREELAAEASVSLLFTALSRLATEHFLPVEVARTALAGAATRLQLQAKDAGESETLLVGGVCPGLPREVIVLREAKPARAGCVPQELGAALAISAESLRLDTPFAERVDGVATLSMKVGEHRLDLARKGTAFVLRAPAERDVALDVGNQLIEDVVGARGERVSAPDLAQLGLAAPAGEVVVSDRSRVRLGKLRSDGSLCVQREADQVVLCLNAESARAFTADSTALRPLALTSFGASELVSVELHSGRGVQRLDGNGQGGFELVAPAGYVRDGALTTDAVQSLGALRAERWVSERDDGSFGLKEPRLRAIFEVKPSEGVVERRELIVGGRTQGGAYARLGTDPAVFIIGAAALEPLEMLLIDRSLFPGAELRGTRLELGRRDGRRLTLLARAEDWSSSPELAPGRALELGLAITSLRAAFAVHLGPATAQEGFAEPALRVVFKDDAGKQRTLLIGKRDTLRDTDIAYARLEGVNATFALPASTLSAISDF